MKRVLVSVLFICLIGLSKAVYAENSITIGIIVPAELPAMDEIVSGFEETLNQTVSKKINYIVQNAQGDLNLQRAIIQQFQQQGVDMLVPIGTAASEMTISMERQTPSVALAAVLNEKPSNVTGVLDEVDSAKSMVFLKAVFPECHEITVIHSADDKIYDEIVRLKEAAAKLSIVIQDLMMQQQSELYSISRQIDKKSDAVFILKDAQVVSGMAVIAQQAQQLGIPVIASDDGSVQEGASFALGVSEEQIGANGARLAANVLAGESPNQMPIDIMKQYTVFINQAYVENHPDIMKTLQAVATKQHYAIKSIGADT